MNILNTYFDLSNNELIQHDHASSDQMAADMATDYGKSN